MEEIDWFGNIPIYFNFTSSNLSCKDVAGTFNPKDNSISINGKINTDIFEDSRSKSLDQYIVFCNEDFNVELIGSITGDLDDGFSIEDETFIKNIHSEILKGQNKQISKLNKEIILKHMNETINQENKIKSSEIGMAYEDFKNLDGEYILNLEDGTFLHKPVKLNIFSGEFTFPIKETHTQAKIVSEVIAVTIGDKGYICDVLEKTNKINSKSMNILLEIFEHKTQHIIDKTIDEQKNQGMSWKI